MSTLLSGWRLRFTARGDRASRGTATRPMVRGVLAGFCFLLVGVAAAVVASATATRPADVPLAAKIEAEIRASQQIYQAGQPVWIEFVLRNLTAEVVTLRVPGVASTETMPPAMGLPLSHVFSDAERRGLEVVRESDESLCEPLSAPPAKPAPVIVLAPYSCVGLRINAAQWYPALKYPGRYRLQWRPYGGQVVSNTLSVKVATLKDAVIHTDFGDMRIRLFYDKAPRHVENFLELVKQGFYDGLTFHRVLRGFVIQGGCPNGDGTGVRPDGKRLKAEFNDVPFKRGTVGMARAMNDPDSASCQFFISLARLPQLDGKFTAFGELVGAESFETLAKIEKVEVRPNRFGEKSQPVKPVYIRSITLEDVRQARVRRLGGGQVPAGRVGP